jgi:Domain of unknown function (DUF4893)
MQVPTFAFSIALFGLVSLAAPVCAQAPIERDWRAVAAARDIERIERWAELFAAAQSWVARMGDTDSIGDPTKPFSSIPLGVPVADIPARWVGSMRCRSISTREGKVTATRWFQCRILALQDGWWIEKTTGSVLLKARLFNDSTLGIVALGDKSTYLRNFEGYTGNAGDWDLAALLRHDGSRMLRVFVPREIRYEVFEIDVGK